MQNEMKRISDDYDDDVAYIHMWIRLQMKRSLHNEYAREKSPLFFVSGELLQ